MRYITRELSSFAAKATRAIVDNNANACIITTRKAHSPIIGEAKRNAGMLARISQLHSAGRSLVARTAVRPPRLR